MKRLLMLAAAAALMSACGFSKPSTFYVLDDGTVPEQSVVSTDANRILIGIEPVFMPNYLDKPQIVIRQADDVTLTASEFNRWAEQPADVFPRQTDQYEQGFVPLPPVCRGAAFRCVL